jgi:hypothetical protein
MDRRQHSRMEWVSPGKIDPADGTPLRHCIVHDLSTGGARLNLPDTAALPERFTLYLAARRGGPRECCVVWRSTRAVGVEFVQPVRVPQTLAGHLARTASGSSFRTQRQ